MALMQLALWWSVCRCQVQTKRLQQPLLRNANFNVSFENVSEFPLADAAPALRLHSAMRRGGEVAIDIPGFVTATTTLKPQPEDSQLVSLVRISDVLCRLERLLGLTLRVPESATALEVRRAEAATAALEGQQADSTFDTITTHVLPGQVRNFVEQLPGETFAMHWVREDYMIRIGDLEIPYGPIALWMPEIRLAKPRRTHSTGRRGRSGRHLQDGRPTDLHPESGRHTPVC